MQNRTMATIINKDNLWSNSLTRNQLTTYAEGLACKNFDQRTLYNVRRYNLKMWLVLKKEAGTKPPSLDESQKLYYDRVRTVCIDPEGYMSCSCGKVQQYLMPCPHMCAVLGEKEYYVSSLFHIRWHKTFNYYHGSKFGSFLASHLCHSLEETLKVTQENCFRMSGKYKGAYMINTPFLNDLEPYVDISTTHYDPVYDVMLRIKNQSDYQRPVVKITIGINTFQSSNVEDPVKELPFYEEQDDVVASMGGSSNVECSLSQDRAMMADTFDSNLVTHNHYYKQALPIFEEMISSCNSKVQFDELMQVMRNQHMKHVASKGINAPIQQNTGTVLFGENNTNLRSVKRHKFMHEKFGNI